MIEDDLDLDAIDPICSGDDCRNPRKGPYYLRLDDGIVLCTACLLETLFIDPEEIEGLLR